ncbi:MULTISPECIES: asparagine synthase (glutamine-hydrolyzing) [unclassified Proteiniphilum]|jgi:asparagine synthase (glutamine-hydrolysing)|uniref:asparagine synthase (glutamine-hydrolyzing) n=1 Tax=unclassified Proteiniphilum TaxID=2622718 RepID=UPI00257FD611|nr:MULTISPECIES: asparagine synthase (glutamine-hydrolyzing) [unclassified Proteiniphilum]
MSGLVGFFSKSGTVDSLAVLRRMLTRIKHRGSGHIGVYVSGCVGLGEGQNTSNVMQGQESPFSNEEESLWIVWSGSVFNRSELKSILVKRRCHVKSDGDAELVLRLYEHFGIKCLNMINGQFAFSILNVAKEELTLARDRVGICPIYYSLIPGGLVFASEIKALFEYPQVTRKISARSLSQIATFWTTITPDTIFEGVSELSPGHYLTINREGLKIESYWEYPVYLPEEYSGLSLAESMDQFDELMCDAVSIRTEPAQPYGAYLSGGLDSSVIISYIKKIHPDLDLNTFSIGFSNPKFDESAYQDIAAEFFRTNRHRLACNDEDIAANFKEVVWHAETTLLRSAPVPIFLLSKLVKNSNIEIVFTGEGSDEILGGYNIYKEAVIREFWSKEPTSKYRYLLLKSLYPYMSQMGDTNEMALKMFFGYKLSETSSPIYSHLLRWNNTSRIRSFFSSDIKAETNDYHPVDELSDKLKSKLKGVDLLSRAQWLEATIFTSGYLLSSQGERMAMAHSVDGRYPFMDHRVIEFCMKLRPSYKLKGLQEKYLLKKMMRNRVPEKIIARQKQPYRAPVASSFRSEYLPDYLQELLSKEKIQSIGIFDYGRVKLLLDKMELMHHITEIDGMAFTAILSTQILNSCFVEKSVPTLIESELVKLDRVVYSR